MGYFPFFMDMEGQEGLIVGGGKVALRKVRRLLPFHPRLTIVAPSIEKELLENPAVTCRERAFEESDICGQMFVIAACDEKDVNHQVARLCRERQIPVNVADDKEACTFLFPALVKEGHLAVGISTEGVSPGVAGYLRGQIEAMLPDGLAEQLEQMEVLREQVKLNVPDQRQRADLFQKRAQQCMNPQETEEGMVTLVGAGCGAYDLITVRGMRLVQSAQVLVYDDLIDERLLSFTGESCEKIYVGKRSGLHSTPQEEINEILIARAKEGKNVVRLKGGDPFVFGRGGEELLALRQAGVKAQVVPGISSAVAVPAAAGIPVTHREVSRSFHVITAHRVSGEDDFQKDMERYASLNGTLVFLMGFGRLEEIVRKLTECGKSPDTSAAVVQGEFDGKVKAVRGCLADIAEKTQKAGMTPPAVILVGECAAMDLFNTELCTVSW